MVESMLAGSGKDAERGQQPRHDPSAAKQAHLINQHPFYQMGLVVVTRRTILGVWPEEEELADEQRV